MKQYSFLTESVLPCKTQDHPHPFKVGDKARVKHGIRCMDSGKEGTVVDVKPHEEYDYDVITLQLKLPASEAPDPLMRNAVNGVYYKLISMNDGSFEKI